MHWVAITVFVILFLLWVSKGTSTSKYTGVTVYGSMGCPWTVKQIDYLKAKGTEYEFVDCAGGGKCPEFVSGFPTSVVNGQTMVGYNEF